MSRFHWSSHEIYNNESPYDSEYDSQNPLHYPTIDRNRIANEHNKKSTEYNNKLYDIYKKHNISLDNINGIKLKKKRDLLARNW